MTNTIRQNISLYFLVILFVFFLVKIFPSTANAACSSYKGRATINEIHRSGNSTRHVEVKLLDASILAATYDYWTVNICSNAQGCTGNISLSAANDSTYPWVVIEKALITDQDYIDLTAGGGMDIILKDGSGNTIDYISIENFTDQQDTSCTPAYDWEGDGSNTKTTAREPDGSGDWAIPGPGNSVPPTTGTTNDTLPDGSSPPRLDISNVTVTAGGLATFTLTLLDPVQSDPTDDYTVTLDYLTIDDTALAGTHYTAASGTITFPEGSAAGSSSEQTIDVSTVSSCAAGADLDFWLYLYNQVNVSLQNQFAIGTIEYSGGGSADHFDIDHDGAGINCLAEGPITVTAEDVGNATVTCFAGTITLNTGTGKGTWTLASGNGTFTDATANDGIATYAYVSSDLGTASFNLLYEEGTSPINISITDGTTTDDDSEGTITFSPSGFTVTASALNPLSIPNPINDPITSQTAGTDFTMHIAAYGQTATDPICGIIEAYDGVKAIKFWSTYHEPDLILTPACCTNQVAVNTIAIATTEAASATQNVTFAAGQASVTVKYKDVGNIQIEMKDDTVTEPAPPTGIAGASSQFVVKPANFTLANIIRTSDAFANPVAVDENGTVFINAGNDFTATVRALDAEGDPTPNYGLEDVPETALLTPALVAAGGANNPAIQFTTGFDFSNAVDCTTFAVSATPTGCTTGTDFSWAEVGIITLTPSISGGDYLGAGDVTGTVTGNVGRFIPDHFTTSFSNGTFANSTGAMTYTGQPFTYTAGLEPTITITAADASNNPVGNYLSLFRKLATTDISLTYPTADSTTNGVDLLTPMAVTTTQTGEALSNAAPMIYTFGADTFEYTRTLPSDTDNALIAPFPCDLLIQLTAIADSDGVTANDLGTPKDITPSCGAIDIRYGRATAMNGFG
ncbi:MAG: hypothetical protein KKE17_13525, partial [Proteobacteria bacterium]|nr:hypothetical protein [Pseudomonadota bacterium]MBU1711017.1 hypothetical protein [Pseudomonadota bacterium]